MSSTREIGVTEALQLVKAKRAPSVSIYVGTDIKDRDGSRMIQTNLQRLLKSIEGVITRAYDPPTRERLLAPLRRLIANARFPRSRGGLGIFHSETFTKVVKLRTPVKDLAVASDEILSNVVFRGSSSLRFLSHSVNESPSNIDHLG